MSTKITKPSILPGFMELTPREQVAFNNVYDVIRRNYESFGFLPIDTPIIEKSEVLLAKTGGDTEKQIYTLTKGSTDMAMRFDLTVPLARYVAQHMEEIAFPFKRYQMGKVYRGERNQRGRFREFYQCDVDVIGNGTLSIVNDAQIPSTIYKIFKELGFDNFKIRINNRKILDGFLKSLNIDNCTEVLRSIDKLAKIGEEKVREELSQYISTSEGIDTLIRFITTEGSNDEKIEMLKNSSVTHERFLEGVSELETVNKYIRAFGIPDKNYIIDFKITRGLDYYTGTVYETFLDDYPEFGSVCSGGRYDDLAQYYTEKKLPGVGISIGLTRLFWSFMESNIIDLDSNSLIDVLVIPMDEDFEYGVQVCNELREAGVKVDIYLEGGKFPKKMKYANKLAIPNVIIIGETEKTENKILLKNMESGDQTLVSVEEGISILKSK
ncbi:histidine--tRNA ligase [Clostridium sp.]|uniref:histidine--tRNA ligase n=1 Tax=Clostridium sp. TaxID=1506 RepID=UPI0032169333